MADSKEKENDAMCRWILALQELHEALKDIDANRESLSKSFGEKELSLLQITTQGSIHRMLGQLPETEGIKNIIPKIDKIVRERGLSLSFKRGSSRKS